MTTLSVDQNSFDREVLQSELPVLVDFWAPWCGPCRAVAPILDAIAEKYATHLRVVKLNIDENPDLAAKYFITSIPALKVFRHGEEVLEIIGAKPQAALEAELAPVLTQTQQ